MVPKSIIIDFGLFSAFPELHAYPKAQKTSDFRPGTNVAQKSGLNRSILRQGWGEFERQLSYKLEWNGGRLIKAGPHYTSQICNKCCHVKKENRNNEQFECLSCGHKDHADINAAKNILALGHRVLVCGDGALASSVKQKPIFA